MAFLDIPLGQSIMAILAKLTNSLVLAAVVFLMGIVVGRLAGKLTFKVLYELELNALAKRVVGVEAALDETVGVIISWAIYALTFLMVLDLLRLDAIFLNGIAILVIILIGVSLIVSMQYAIPNVFAGILIGRRKIVRQGDHIRLGTLSGKVAHTGLFEITIHAKDKDIIYVPNASLLKEKHFVVKRG